MTVYCNKTECRYLSNSTGTHGYRKCQRVNPITGEECITMLPTAAELDFPPVCGGFEDSESE